MFLHLILQLEMNNELVQINDFSFLFKEKNKPQISQNKCFYICFYFLCKKIYLQNSQND